MPAQRLKIFLDQNNVDYKVIRHSPAFTSQGTAHAAFESGKEFAKTVMLKIDEELIMVVIQTDHRIDLEYLRQELGVRNIRLAAEEEFKDLFPDCEPGAMPPLGELYDVDVFIDECFAENEMISFNAGTHHEIIKMRYKDFIDVANAKPVRFILMFARE